MMYEMQEQHHPLPLIREGRRKTVDQRGRRSVEEDEMTEAVDLSGLSLDSLPNPSINLTIISRLDLSNNNLQNIPESLTARLLNVVALDIHSNQLKSLPNSIGCLSKLKFLNVSSNLLESLPRTIENCRSLEELNANFNKLRILPETLGFELINLKKLLVNSNKLVILPHSTSHLTHLRALDVHLNCLTCLPDDLENLVHLRALNVSQNFHHLTTLPYSIGLLLSLVDLDVSYNNITSLPDSIGCLKSLERLSVDGNPLVSPPPEIVERGLTAVKEYLGAKMNNKGEQKKKSWVKRLVKYATFNGTTRSAISEDREGLILPECRLIDGLASPRYTGMFSPRRLFSPRKIFQ